MEQFSIDAQPKKSSPVEEAAEIAAQWYIAPKPPGRRGWLVFSEEAILRVLQKKRESTEPVSRSAGWRIAAGLILAIVAIFQALIMLLAILPIVGGAMEPLVTFWRRGQLGFFVRAAYWKAKLAHLGQDTLIDRGVEIWGAGNMEIGSACHIDTYVRLAAGESGMGQHGKLVIGDYTHIGPRCHIAARGGVTIGDLVSLQAGVHVYSASNALVSLKEPGKLLSFSHMPPADLQATDEGPVTIEDYASIGYASILLPRVTIGRGAVVQPQCQVSRSFPAFANIVGPGKAKQNGWRRPLRLDPRREVAKE
ncbi:MAG: hypothetical protein AB7N71_01790 [Phycisphaerae bacterium]